MYLDINRDIGKERERETRTRANSERKREREREINNPEISNSGPSSGPRLSKAFEPEGCGAGLTPK